MKGSTVCDTHGGKARQVKAKAAERQALALAGRMAARAGVDKPPIDHLLDSLHAAAQQVAVWEIMVAAIDERAEEEAEQNGFLRGELGYEEVPRGENAEGGTDVIVTAKDRLMAVNAKGEAKVHPYVEQLEKWTDKRAKFAKMCIDAGIAQMQLDLLESQVQQAMDAFERTLETLGLDAAKKQEARRSYGGHLRSVA
jgi:hypothetical protein